jgi:hypothetical protein
MTSKSLLIAYPGIPFTLQNLMPNPRLASLAAALIAQGHETQIADAATMGSFRCLYRGRAQMLAAEVSEHLWPARGVPALRTRLRLRLLDRLLAEAQDRLYAQIVELVSRKAPDFIVFDIPDEKAWGGSKRLASLVRACHRELPIVVCGPFAEAFAVSIVADSPFVDGVLLPDAELGVVELAARIRSRDQWGVAPNFYDGTRAFPSVHRVFIHDLDTLPGPHYGLEIYPALAGDEKILIMPLEEARGAVFPSNYRVQEFAPPLRSRSAPAIARLMQQITRDSGSSAFHFLCAEAPAALIRGVAAEVVARNLGALYSRGCHVHCMDGATAGALAGSGGRCVGFRVDSGSQRLLEDHYGHTYGVTTVEQALRACIQADLHTTAWVTYPCPQDDPHTRAETERLLLRTQPHGVAVQFPRVWPQSRWYALRQQFGYNRCDVSYGVWLTGDTHGRAYARWRWPTVPFNRAGGHNVFRQRGSFVSSLGSLPIGNPATPEGALAARLCGYTGREAVFLAQLDHQLVSGDAWRLAAMVGTCNQQAADLRRDRYRPFSSGQRAMGN